MKAKKLPTLDEEFVKEQNIPNVTTVEELKEHLRAKKLEEAKNKVRNDFINKVVEEINKNSKIDIPEEILDNQVEQRKQDFLQRMSQSGLSLEQYLQVIGQTEEQFESQLKTTAAKETANYLILEEIAKKEEIEVTDADVDFEIAKLADQYKMTAEDVKKAVGGQLDQFKNQIKMQRVENVLWNNND